MIGLRYFACGRCDTVVALPQPQATCGRCGADSLAELPPDDTAAAYFTPTEQS
jgi:hypothetical protein